jgi:hypothetical protein
VVTVWLFLGMLAAKVALATAAYFLDVSDDDGFGEILVIIAVMVAFHP